MSARPGPGDGYGGGPGARGRGGSAERGIPDGLLVGVLGLLLGLTLLVWSATGLSALLAHGSWPRNVSFLRTPMALRHLVGEPQDLPTAWPDTPPDQLSGYGLFWGILIGELMVLFVLAVFVIGTATRYRLVRARRRAERLKGAVPAEAAGTDPHRAGPATGMGSGAADAMGADGDGMGAGGWRLPAAPDPRSAPRPTPSPPATRDADTAFVFGRGDAAPPGTIPSPSAPGQPHVAGAVAPGAAGPPSGPGVPGLPQGLSAYEGDPAALGRPAPSNGASVPSEAATGPLTAPVPDAPPVAGAHVPSPPMTGSHVPAPHVSGHHMSGPHVSGPQAAGVDTGPVPTPRGAAFTASEAALPRLIYGTQRGDAAVRAVLDAEGPVLAVTSDPELWKTTKDARAKLGPVHVFDPSHLLDTPARLRWNPAAGCAAREVAAARAAALLAPVRPGHALDRPTAEAAETLLRCWLHAAAVDGRPFRQVHRWAQGNAAHEPVRILRTHPKAAGGTAGELEATLTAHPERRDMAQELTARALGALSSIHIRDACNPGRADGLALESFITEGGTLYVVGESIEDPRTHPGAMPLLTALASSVVERGRRMAERSSSGRLDPPLTLVLDDVAAVAPIPALPDLLTAGGSQGLLTLALMRSQEQARTRWPDAHKTLAR
ncbi:TraM recognition domain-containing protein [Streptomyces sp. SAJ15]|uniref:TraM recognition domain-containing protein n=1 Tax=Streptomyces sp. SAJ15 TaxID=2011095 RepID=UPI0021B4693E|nr:hypothetical protein [Streptomyces sp. SAJ15]